MMKIKSRKKAILAFAVIALAVVITTSVLAYPAFATEEPEFQSKHVYVRARGIAVQKIDNETIKTPVNLTLTLVLGEKRGNFIPVLNVNGSIDVNSTIYTIEYGDGIIQTQRHVAFIRCVGFDADGNQLILRIRAPYFWWGRKLYVFRAKALLRTVDTRMLLLLRGIAKVQ